ncbi:MAG: hypothetical protein Kow0062_22430 [Acidobacteriota bacterium]
MSSPCRCLENVAPHRVMPASRWAGTRNAAALGTLSTGRDVRTGLRQERSGPGSAQYANLGTRRVIGSRGRATIRPS